VRDLHAFAVDERTIRAIEVADLQISTWCDFQTAVHSRYQCCVDDEVCTGCASDGLDAAGQQPERALRQIVGLGSKNPHRRGHREGTENLTARVRGRLELPAAGVAILMIVELKSRLTAT
jgi:hypothetical protein